ncbi:MAG: hypothetical protein ACSHXL_00885 [Bacteroidota bacterium]
MKFVFFGHHKIASSWMIRYYWNVFCDSGIPFYTFNEINDQNREGLNKIINDQASIGIAIQNASPEDVKLFDNFIGIHFVRDPRDLIISAYHSHKSSHPVDLNNNDSYHFSLRNLALERELLKDKNISEGLDIVTNGLVKKTLSDMENWPDSTAGIRLLEYDFSDFRENPNLLKTPFEGILQPENCINYWLRAIVNQSYCRLVKKNEAPWKTHSLSAHSCEKQMKRILKSRAKRVSLAEKTGSAGHHRKYIKNEKINLIERKHLEQLERICPNLLSRYI